MYIQYEYKSNYLKSLSITTTNLYSLVGSWIEGYFLSKTDWTSDGACEGTDLLLQGWACQCKSCGSIPLCHVQPVKAEVWQSLSNPNEDTGLT